MMTPKRLASELTARLDGPHADEHTAAAADLCAEAVRFLNYATGSHSPAGLVYPSTVYLIAGDLGLAAKRMTQLFAQLDDWLDTEDLLGHLGTDDGQPSTDVVATPRENLVSARAAANCLCARLEALQNSTSGRNGRGPDRREGGA
jgi:hypothetical protein